MQSFSSITKPCTTLPKASKVIFKTILAAHPFKNLNTEFSFPKKMTFSTSLPIKQVNTLSRQLPLMNSNLSSEPLSCHPHI